MKQNVMEPSSEQGQDGGHSTSFIRDLCHHSNGKLIYKNKADSLLLFLLLLHPVPALNT